MNTPLTHAIVDTESGMLHGLGCTESAAWEDAERSCEQGRVTLDRARCHVAIAVSGYQWAECMDGGICTAEQVEL